VPRIFEKVYNTAKNQAHAGGRGALFERYASGARGARS